MTWNKHSREHSDAQKKVSRFKGKISSVSNNAENENSNKKIFHVEFIRKGFNGWKPNKDSWKSVPRRKFSSAENAKKWIKNKKGEFPSARFRIIRE